MVEKAIEVTSRPSEYVVRGAKIRCRRGSNMEVINIPSSHGVLIKDKYQLNVADSKPGINIRSFGLCRITDTVCTPSIRTKWVNLYDTNLLIEEEEALIKDAILFCTQGGMIEIIDSGQE